MKLEPIRLRLVPRSPREASDPRIAFWRAAKDQVDNLDVNELEGKLRRQFGPALRELLVQQVVEPLRQFDAYLNRGELGSLEHILFRFFDRPDSDKYWDRTQALEAFTRLLEQRQQAIRESTSLRRIQERLAAAGAVNFSVRLAGYSSLNLELSVGSLLNLVEAFDRDFESFRVFLEAFVPQAYGRVFWEAEADRIDFDVHIPTSFEHAFNAAAAPLPQSTSSATVAQATVSPPPSTSARDRAEWLWRLANGSLLVPLVLALAVMYYGMAMLRDYRTTQAETLKPILDHQLKLLEEDRRRLFRETAASSAPSAPTTASAK